MTKLLRSISIISAAVGAAAHVPVVPREPVQHFPGGIPVKLTYDVKYDIPNRPLPELKCWDDKTRSVGEDFWGWQVQGEIIPGIIGVDSIMGPNSTACGVCYEMHYEDNSRFLFAFDGAPKGKAVISLDIMDELTDGMSVILGEIDIEIVSVPRINCGFSDGPEDEMEEFGDEDDIPAIEL